MVFRSISSVDNVDEIVRLVRGGEYRLTAWSDSHGSSRTASRYWFERRQTGPDGQVRWHRCPGTHELLRLASRQLRGRFDAGEGITIYQ